MQDNIHPLIQHTPTDSGNVSVPALKVLSEITTSLSTDANVEQLLGRFLSTMIRLAGAQAGAVRVITDDRTHLRLIGSVGLMIAFYYGLTGFACVWFYRKDLTKNARDFMMRGVNALSYS